jgi:hypothetical protein
MRQIDQPLSLRDAGISEADFEARFAALCDLADSDHNLLMGPRIPDRGETERLFRYAYEGRPVDF